MKQNNPCYLFSMYEPDTDSVIVNAINDTYTGTPLSISCKKYNSSVLLDTPNDIYCIIEKPYKHYFTEKVSYSHLKQSFHTTLLGLFFTRKLLSHIYDM